MATVTSVVSSARGNSQRGRNTYMVENTIDFAGITVDPSAGDIVQAITVPAGTAIVGAGMYFVTAPTVDNGTDAVATLGTDTDADKYVAALDFDAASAGDYAAAVTGTGGIEVQGAANTIDITFSATNADGISAGKVRVWAILADITGMGDMAANEVDRDTLA